MFCGLQFQYISIVLNLAFNKNKLYKILDYWLKDNPANICWSSRRLQDVFWRCLSKENIFVLIKTSSEGEDERRVQDVFIKTNVCWKSQFCFFRKGSGNGFSNVWIFRKNVFHVIFYSLSDCLYFLRYWAISEAAFQRCF